MSLQGNEILYVTGIQPNGQLAATQEQTTTGAIAVAPFSAEAVVATPDNGTTQTLTAAMVTGGAFTAHVSASGSTPSLTMPTAAALIAGIPGFQIGQSYLLRVINTNSGTATIVTNTGITTTGTLTLATETWREFVITMTGAATLSMVSVGTGTNS